MFLSLKGGFYIVTLLGDYHCLPGEGNLNLKYWIYLFIEAGSLYVALSALEFIA